MVNVAGRITTRAAIVSTAAMGILGDVAPAQAQSFDLERHAAAELNCTAGVTIRHISALNGSFNASTRVLSQNGATVAGINGYLVPMQEGQVPNPDAESGYETHQGGFGYGVTGNGQITLKAFYEGTSEGFSLNIGNSDPAVILLNLTDANPDNDDMIRVNGSPRIALSGTQDFIGSALITEPDGGALSIIPIRRSSLTFHDATIAQCLPNLEEGDDPDTPSIPTTPVTPPSGFCISNCPGDNDNDGDEDSSINREEGPTADTGPGGNQPGDRRDPEASLRDGGLSEEFVFYADASTGEIFAVPVADVANDLDELTLAAA